jgi:hypothetical protein
MIVVTTPDWNAVEGTLQRYERGTPHDTWRPAGELIAIVAGQSGMGWGIGVDRPFSLIGTRSTCLVSAKHTVWGSSSVTMAVT